MEASEAIQREMTIDADATTVFAFFTDQERLIRWMGVAADLQPRRGGLMLVEVQPAMLPAGSSRKSFRCHG